MTTTCVLIYVAAAQQCPLFQLDVKNAFLNGSLSEEVYMRPPSGFSSPFDFVCHLRRVLYGLKQSPAAQYEHFQSVVLGIRFQSSPHNSTLLIRRTSIGIVLLLLYVDDKIIIGSDASTISEVKQSLFSEVETKDLSLFRYFLDIEVAYSPKGYLLFQSKYANEIISRAQLTYDKVVDTLIELHDKFFPLDGPTVYRELVGCLVYLIVTRPDIAYGVHVVSQFVFAPRSTHWVALLLILQ